MNFPLISKNSMTKVNKELFDMYTTRRCRIDDRGADDMCNDMFRMTGEEVYSNIEAVIAGDLDDFGKSILCEHYDVTRTDLAISKKTSSGHPFLRGSANLNRLRAFSDLRRLFRDNRSVRVVDLGSKFCAESKIFLELTTAHISGNFRFSPVRPQNMCSADKSYYNDNEPTYIKRKCQNESSLMSLFKGTLEDYLLELTDNQSEFRIRNGELLVFQMNDCHYYLSDTFNDSRMNRLRNDKPQLYQILSESQVLLSGSEFPPVFGTKIQLPFGEGFYDHVPDVLDDQKDGVVKSRIVMYTKGDKKEYSHPSVLVEDVDSEANMHYFSHVYKRSTFTNLRLTPMYIPLGLEISGNPQRQLFDNF